ncbi:heavy metal translocating P-type ATPase [Acaricomes phytoseiuli]|uniref:heavy metal translocating P-type ATPase n=1 Tax=Acaricomes phytoseiuli TaxID=291968 RepID=UPI000375C6FA|nr:heavy metal translocating P-type ATPase [Acaricomes phytoseiuli]MCW1248608.1 heavy metal translocating P-type ATPase [Acaricomes phytoseiuli]
MSVTMTDQEPVELELSGMTCSACALRIQKKLNRLDGVEASVNFATERAVLRNLEPERVQEAVAAVEAAGYGAVPVNRDSRGSLPEASAPDQSSMLLRRLVVAALLTLPLGNLAIVLALVPSLRFPFWDWLCVAIATPVVFWCAWPFYRAAARNLRHGAFSMDTLVSIGVLAAYFWSVFAIAFSDKTTPGYWVGFGQTPPGADSIYLEVAAGVTTFLLAGRYFEAKSRRKAADVLGALARLAVGEVRVLRPASGAASETAASGTAEPPVEMVIDVRQLRPGDLVVVRPGERVGCDGVVVEGRAGVDTSAMTGEAEPRFCEPGSEVSAGTVVLDGRLVIRATGIGQNTQLAQLTALAEHAQTRKANVQALVERIVSVFVPVILILSVVVFAAWMLTGNSLERAFGSAIAVLIIACPCALGLATPMALMVGVGRGSQLGILIKSQQALESSGRIDTVVLDKTGTLTTGQMQVSSFELLGSFSAPSEQQILELAAAAEADTEHPTGRAVLEYARQQLGVEQTAPAEEFRAVPGAGVSALVSGHSVTIGNRRMMADLGLSSTARLPEAPQGEEAGATEVFMALDGDLVARFLLRDGLREGAGEAVAELHRMGLRVVLLSGDRPEVAAELAEHLGIEESIAGVLPAGKAEVITELQSQGRKVAMVGDGINDAAALATANLGLALVTGTDVAMKSADIILVRQDTRVIPEAIALARRTLGTVRSNLIWAFVYNIAALPLAAFGLLNPLIAGAAMALSSLFVVSNSLRLRNFVPLNSSEIQIPGAPMDQESTATDGPVRELERERAR